MSTEKAFIYYDSKKKMKLSNVVVKLNGLRAITTSAPIEWNENDCILISSLKSLNVYKRTFINFCPTFLDMWLLHAAFLFLGRVCGFNFYFSFYCLRPYGSFPYNTPSNLCYHIFFITIEIFSMPLRHRTLSHYDCRYVFTIVANISKHFIRMTFSFMSIFLSNLYDMCLATKWENWKQRKEGSSSMWKM